jgi:dinuclear metal center YbgI/SA1388 family protein
MAVKCYEIMNELEDKYPLSLSEDYDNVGLIIGDRDKEINNILVCLEIDNKVVEEAKDNKIDLIISHHPLIFKPLKKIVKTDYISSIVMKLIRSDINVYAMHTNFDNAKNGMNDILANLLKLNNVKPLTTHKSESLFKLVVYVPLSHQHVVREAILNAGAGHIGNYSHCSFNLYGTGTFKPLEGANPYIGKQGEIEKVNEAKIETIVEESKLNIVLKEMFKAHPYEEVAYDIYPLKNKLDNGTGRYGTLENKMPFNEFCNYVKSSIGAPNVNVVGRFDKEIYKVAVVGGAGGSFIKDAISKGCDVLITGDIKHHEAIDAINMGLNIIDAGHYFTEVVALPYVGELIKSKFDVDVHISNISTNPFKKI